MVSCATRPSQPPPVVGHVDLRRYAGTWHEAARLPMFFQNGCVNSTAEYRLRADGCVDVINRCVLQSGGSTGVRGVACSVDPVTNARLEVRFDTWFGWLIPRAPEGNYWILSLSSDYSVAMVGTPDRRCLWILARKLPLPASTFDHLVAKARELGYPVDALIVDPAQRAASASSPARR